jgi:hypothetical protein
VTTASTVRAVAADIKSLVDLAVAVIVLVVASFDIGRRLAPHTLERVFPIHAVQAPLAARPEATRTRTGFPTMLNVVDSSVTVVVTPLVIASF